MANKENQDATFIFTVSKETKRSFESPVILVTFKDYAEGVSKALVDIRSALLRNAPTHQLIDIISNFHFDWLQAVQEIEDFTKRIKETPHEVIQNSIDFSIKCANNRFTSFKNFEQNLTLKLPIEDRRRIQADLEIINDMKESVTSVLLDKKSCFRFSADKTEYLAKLKHEIQELLNWLDRLNDNLALQISKIIHQVPQLPKDLSDTLKQVIDEVVLSIETNANTIDNKGKLQSSMFRGNDLKVDAVVKKIKVIEERTQQLKAKDPSEVLALRHKVIYLEERLQSLDNLKACLNALKQNESTETSKQGDDLESAELHVFNHNLPSGARNRVVERLVKLWDTAIGGDAVKSIVSILSVADLKEVFSDEMGQFTVDTHGRKLYFTKYHDTIYQLNDKNELVELCDDDRHIYFYDNCGRYYVNENGVRIYKAHESASEYELCPSGKLMKYKEIINGIEYTYDNNGRYYVNELGNRIYCDPETEDKYEQDGFGNLVRISSETSFFKPCATLEPMAVKECFYLKSVVGDALKKCLANVLLHQPADPVGFLADNLEKYGQNTEMRQRRLDEGAELAAEREYHENTISAPLLSHVTEEETSFFDYN